MNQPRCMAPCLVLSIVLLLASCAANLQPSARPPGTGKTVDSGYEMRSADDVNQSNRQVETNRNNPSNLSLDIMVQQLPGVRLKSGRGAYSQFTVDGTSQSFMADTSPLFVVDGRTIGTDFPSVYTMVNPNDVVSMSVLKGADASIYGSRGANGVILIRTGKK